MIEKLTVESTCLSREAVMATALFSRSQLYAWRSGVLERKQRAPKGLPEKTVENAAALVATYPHLGGRKGQACLLYHELGYVGQKQYDKIKDRVKRLIIQELSRRHPCSSGESFEHERPRTCGEIWAEDFTEITVEGEKHKVAVLVDVFDGYFLGSAAEQRANTELVSQPVDQALKKTGKRGPARFLLCDHGKQYVSKDHQEKLNSAQIVQRLIPVCVPHYNGWVEGGIRGLKSVFYSIWEKRKRQGTDEGKTRLERVRVTLAESVRILNEWLPRPRLGGVTPHDVQSGHEETRQAQIRAYREQEASRPVEPWRRPYWDVLKSGAALAGMTGNELRTKLAFFGRRPLRRIAKQNRESVG